MDGKVHTYKARLVAKAYTQTHEIDYEETFSPVAKIKSIRIMLAIAAFHDYEIWQMDVKTAFLNGKSIKDLCPKTDDELDRMSRVPYASAIGSIMYAMTYTRSDVSFALSMVSRHQQNPGEVHWIAVKNILNYLRNIKDRFLVYGGEEELRMTAVTWKSSKQNTVTDSTCESEYITACEDSKEAIWMKNFIGDLEVVSTVQDPIEIFCDNESRVALTKEPKDHGKLMHKIILNN
ncbi:retrotransposon protein, putative, ty1-copia subclass [Tanacetum coccineum]